MSHFSNIGSIDVPDPMAERAIPLE